MQAETCFSLLRNWNTFDMEAAEIQGIHQSSKQKQQKHKLKHRTFSGNIYLIILKDIFRKAERAACSSQLPQPHLVFLA